MASNPISSSPSLPSIYKSLSLETHNTHRPWLDLPDPLTENILERLPISDYVRFSAVCPQWRSIQRHHRRRHAPSPPPLLRLPWFIPARPEQDLVPCSSPFENRSYRLRLPLSRRYLEYRGEKRCPACSFSFPNGWLLLDDIPSWSPRSYYFTLSNPISGAQIELPVINGTFYFELKAAVSPPAADGPAVLLLTIDKGGKRCRLFRADQDEDWLYVPFPGEEMGWDSVSLLVISVISWKGKFYCMYLSRGLIVIDPFPSKPTVQFLDMDQGQLPVLGTIWENDVEDKMELFLVDSNGELLLVVEIFRYEPTHTTRALAGFQVFEADFSRKRWVRAETLGDRALFIYRNFAASLVAADVGVRGNCIYCIDPSKEEPAPWSEFDLGTGSLSDALLACPPSPFDHLMFVPSIC